MSGISLDMMKKVELVEDHVEECPTLGVAVGLQIKRVRNRRLDGHVVDGMR
jgi:hypothetical protein